jgi:hypothetical protein
MLEFLGYIILVLSIAGSVAIVYYIHSYLLAIICFWLGITIASMLILHFKES